MTGTAPVPFTADDYKARMDRAARQAADAGLAGLLVAPGPDLVWLTGYAPPAVTERLTLLVLAAGREPVLVVPTLEAPDAEKAPGAPALALRDWTDGKDPTPSPRPPRPQGALRRQRQRLGAAPAGTSAGPSRHLVRVPHRGAADAARREGRRRTGAARRAGAAADAAFEEIRNVRFSGRRESEVAADLAALLRRFGHSQVDFTIVASGPNGANPHHEAGDRRIERGDMVVLDFGGLKDGYGSDTSRTVHVGEPTDEERRVHDLVREAQEAGFRAVRPGAACQDVDRAARAVIDGAGYGEYFIHRTGHGIGVTTHEPPYMIEGEERPLVPGMCFSVEPGVYLPGRFGVRIEDIVTVTEDGGRRLNDTERGMVIVD